MDLITKYLDCEVADGVSPWHELRQLTQEHLNFAGVKVPSSLLLVVRRVLRIWTPLALLRARQELSAPLTGRAPLPPETETSCIYGVMTANFWHCFDISSEASSLRVERCLKRITRGPLVNMDTRENWGPLEFSQSSRWPLHLLDVRLVQDQWTACSENGLSVSSCPAVGLPKLRLLHGLAEGISVPTAPSKLVLQQLDLSARDLTPPLHAVKKRFGTKAFHMVVIGSHMGSNMEPLSMVEACFAQAGVPLASTVLGTTYPFPEIMCESFGHCEQNRHIDAAVRLLVQQMYRPTWEPQHLLNLLHAGLKDPSFGEPDIFLCAQPMALCSFLRSLISQPMLLYQAFPLVGATPEAFRHLLLVQLREVQVSNPKRSSLIAYSEFLAQQVQRQTGQRPVCLRPHSLYAVGAGARTSTYDPDTRNPRVLLGRMAGWARDGAGAMVHLMEAFAQDMLRPGTSLRLVFLGLSREASETVAGIARPFSYHELRRFRAAVYFPWDMGMLLFSELYAIGVPTFLPDKAWVVSIIKRMLEYTDFGWWQAREEGSSVALPSDSNFTLDWPWFGENSTMAHLLSLYGLTDFARWPYVTTFPSLARLMASLRDADFDATSRLMLRWNEASLPLSLNILGRTLTAMLDNTSDPSDVDESSCV
eukprot:s275_g6.t1